jgi:hypothetical protein
MSCREFQEGFSELIHVELAIVEVRLTVFCCCWLAIPCFAAEKVENVFAVVTKSPSLMLTNYTGTVSIKGWATPEIKVISMKYSQNVEIDTEASPNRVRVFHPCTG